LSAVRRRDPAAGRALFTAALAELDARERARLLACLREGLDMADEACVTALLQDRSKEVRQTAAELLARLPASAYVGGMTERLAACLRSERKFLRSTWVLEPPETFDAAWKRDGLEETPTQADALGPRAWWLYQMARALPLAWWTAHSGMAPADLVKWAHAGDWSSALLRAWLEAVMRERDADWAATLLDAQPPPSRPADEAHALIGMLAQPAREQRWAALLELGPRQQARGELLARIARMQRAAGQALSVAFARRALRAVAHGLADEQARWDTTLRTSLLEFACVLPLECLDDAAQGWPAERDDTRYFTETLARLLTVVEQRRVLNRHFTEPGSP
ncbi:MAG: DUF5691 domain-containing protein, partial [Rhodocyclaceae bacterium]